MKYLLDTHVFLWMLGEPEKLSETALALTKDLNNKLYFSSASGLQIGFLAKEGKIQFPKNTIDYLMEILEKFKIQNLPVNLYHSLYSTELPAFHQDPFTRLLIAQSVLEDLPIISNDPILEEYSVKTIW